MSREGREEKGQGGIAQGCRVGERRRHGKGERGGKRVFEKRVKRG